MYSSTSAAPGPGLVGLSSLLQPAQSMTVKAKSRTFKGSLWVFISVSVSLKARTLKGK
jgi:hypothetical protein